MISLGWGHVNLLGFLFPNTFSIHTCPSWDLELHLNMYPTRWVVQLKLFDHSLESMCLKAHSGFPKTKSLLCTSIPCEGISTPRDGLNMHLNICIRPCQGVGETKATHISRVQLSMDMHVHRPAGAHAKEPGSKSKQATVAKASPHKGTLAYWP